MKKLITSFSIVVLSLLLSVGVVSAAVNPTTPSTNDANRTNGWAHVDQLSQGVGTTDLQFISTRAFLSCFEYRTDGDTSQALLTANPNPAVSDRYPHHCQNNNSNTYTINANGYVEVRMVFGAEEDERFDWTRFDVEQAPDVCGNLDGYQATLPDGMQVENEDFCSCKEGYHEVNSEGLKVAADGLASFTCVADEPEVTPTPEVTPIPTQTPNVGGPGDGLSDGRSDGRSSCPECTQAPSGSVLGASTGPAVLGIAKGPAVLGLSTTSGEESVVLQLVQILGALVSGVAGFTFFKKNA